MRRRILFFLSIVVWPIVASAQKNPLSLEEAVRIGIENSPALHASQMKAEEAAAVTREIAAGRLPILRFGAGYTRLSEVPDFAVSLPPTPENPSPSSFVVSRVFFNSYSLRLALEQPLFTGFRLQAGEEAARALEEASNQNLAGDTGEFVFAVKKAYWSLARALEFEKVIVRNLGQVEAHLADVKALFSQGVLLRNDVLRVETERSNVAYLRLEAANAVKLSSLALCSLIGLPLDGQIEIVTDPESLVDEIPSLAEPGDEAPSSQERIRAALADRPDILSALSRIKASEAGVKGARSGRYPQVALSGNYYYLRPNPRILPNEDRFHGTWDIGISLSIDIWDWSRTKHLIERAKTELAQAKDARRLLEDKAVLEITSSRIAVAQAREKIAVSRQAVGPAAENLRITRERFRQGLALNTDVLDAEETLLRAELNRTQAAIDLALALAELQKATGK